MFACHFLLVVWHSNPPLCVPLLLTATPWLPRIFRGEQRQPAETKIPLYPEEASGAHQQDAEAVYLKTKCNLLTARTAEATLQGTRPYTLCEDVIVLISSLLVAEMLYFLIYLLSFTSRRFGSVSDTEACLPVFCSSRVKVLKIKSWASSKLCVSTKNYLFTVSALHTKCFPFQDTIKGLMV